MHVRFRNEQGELDFAPAALRVDGPIRLGKPIFADAFRFLQQTVTTAVPKLTIPSPSMVHYRGGRADRRGVPDQETVIGHHVNDCQGAVEVKQGACHHRRFETSLLTRRAQIVHELGRAHGGAAFRQCTLRSRENADAEPTGRSDLLGAGRRFSQRDQYLRRLKGERSA